MRLSLGLFINDRMSASGGELNALATATIIYFYKRHFVTAASDDHYLRVSKAATPSTGITTCSSTLKSDLRCRTK